MIHIDFDPANLSDEKAKKWWTDWQKEAKAATEEVITAWEISRRNPADTAYKTIFNKKAIQEVWAKLKNWLLDNVFDEKCAYCETKLDRASLHAEHYRPKARVTSAKSKVKVMDDSGQTRDHPGYFWLAFHWKNLLPACEWCNTVNGKRNEFPIEKQEYVSVWRELTQDERNALNERQIQSQGWPDLFYLQPVDLDKKEGRLLLHPYLDQPEKSLRFDAFGQVISVGQGDDKTRGEKSIEAYNLNQEKIVAARYKAQKDAYLRFIRYQSSFVDGQKIDPIEAKRRAKDDLLKYIKDNKEPYTAAILDYLRRYERDAFTNENGPNAQPA